MIAIDKMTVGAPPAGFELARTGQGGPAQWAVVADATAAGGRAIEQTSTDTTDYRFPLAIYREVSAVNVNVASGGTEIVLAGGTAAADATSFTLMARPGHPQYSIGENKYLAEHASTLSYDVTVTINDDGSWSYDETTMLKMDEFPEPFAHTDRNILRKVG